MSNCPEFGWEYSHGRGQSNNFSQMGMNGSSPGAGRQWLHSNQAYTANTGNTGSMQNSGQNSYGSPSDPFESYNQSMMNQYGKYNPSYGHSLMGPATVNVMMQDSPQGMGNGMGHGMDQSMGMEQSMGQFMGQGMGQGMRNGHGSIGANPRLSGGFTRRSNGM
ncbi:hypothetical protein KR200_004165 [Drosophila serrata]|nr:hypothetical protein KR200_004165 [Drosophila serrata]